MINDFLQNQFTEKIILKTILSLKASYPAKAGFSATKNTSKKDCTTRTIRYFLLDERSSTFPFSNNMSESIHHTFKNIFLRDYIPYDKEDLKLKLKEFEHFYGNILYPLELYGYTTQEVLHGAIPDKHRFALQIEASKKIRPEENRRTSFCDECLSAE